MIAIWYLDRSTAIVAYVALWSSVLSGILYNARGFGPLHRAARMVHTPGSVIAATALVAHAVLGTIDAVLVATGEAPHPAYSDAWLLGGLVIGVSALLLVVTSVLGFLDARRFQRPWDPRTVHALAYGAFAFASIHAVALGSDVSTWLAAGGVAASVFLVLVLVLRTQEKRLAHHEKAT